MVFLYGHIEHYLIGLLKNNRELSVSDIRLDIKKQFNIDIERSTINNFRKTHGLERIIKPVSQTEEVQFAGFEIISTLAYHTGIVDVWSDAIKKFWAELNNEHPRLLCYYLDGNTKPIWSGIKESDPLQ